MQSIGGFSKEGPGRVFVIDCFFLGGRGSLTPANPWESWVISMSLLFGLIARALCGVPAETAVWAVNPAVVFCAWRWGHELGWGCQGGRNKTTKPLGQKTRETPAKLVHGLSRIQSEFVGSNLLNLVDFDQRP